MSFNWTPEYENVLKQFSLISSIELSSLKDRLKLFGNRFVLLSSNTAYHENDKVHIKWAYSGFIDDSRPVLYNYLWIKPKSENYLIHFPILYSEFYLRFRGWLDEDLPKHSITASDYFAECKIIRPRLSHSPISIIPHAIPCAALMNQSYYMVDNLIAQEQKLIKTKGDLIERLTLNKLFV